MHIYIFIYVAKSPFVKVHQVTDTLLKKSMFNFSQTVGEMVFVHFEVVAVMSTAVLLHARFCVIEDIG